MANVTFNNDPAHTAGDLPAVGESIPDFTVVGTDLSDITPAAYEGKRLVISLFPSIDTGVCQAQTRSFNEKANGLDNTVVLCISKDLPFALDRFCAAEGLDNVVAASAFRSSFGEDFGATLQDSPLAGLLARGVIVTDEDHKVVYAKFVDEVTTEPDYDEALSALQ
ncbi:thiol peroxidase [Corynebacterium sp. L4756]|uniref:thiol peroxidase n=1 Tax=unclassified Corynebacterium TaxID=2624378 RepID=UPI00374D97B3